VDDCTQERVLLNGVSINISGNDPILVTSGVATLTGKHYRCLVIEADVKYV
jgi:hypothetical protein